MGAKGGGGQPCCATVGAGSCAGVRAVPCRAYAIVGNEVMERVCYYSVRAMLVVYLTTQLRYTDAEAVVGFSLFTAFAHVTPVLGGLLADAVLGSYATILLFGAVYLAGVLVLGGTAFATDVDDGRRGMVTGLALMALGTGGIKPCVSTFGASQVGPPRLVVGGGTAGVMVDGQATFFALYYWGVNLGSTLSFIVSPIIRQHAGFGWAFLAAGFTLAAALVVFTIPRYTHTPPSWSASAWAAVYRVVHACCLRCHARQRASCCGRGGKPGTETGGVDAGDEPDLAGGGGVVVVRGDGGPSAEEGGPPPAATARNDAGSAAGAVVYGDSGAEESMALVARPGRQPPTPPRPSSCRCVAYAQGWGRATRSDVSNVRIIVRLLPLFAVMPLYWMIFDAQGSIWVLQRMRMDNCMGTLCLTPEQLGCLNPILVLLLVPLVNGVIMPAMELWGSTSHPSPSPTKPRPFCEWSMACWHPLPLRRMAVGMQLAALSYVATALLQAAIDANPPGSVNALWQVPQFVLVTVAELLVSITGLEFAFRRSPTTMRSTIMSLYLLAVAVGDLVTGALYGGLSTVMTPTALAWLLAGLMCAGGIVFLFLAHWYMATDAEGGDPEPEGAASARGGGATAGLGHPKPASGPSGGDRGVDLDACIVTDGAQAAF